MAYQIIREENGKREVIWSETRKREIEKHFYRFVKKLSLLPVRIGYAINERYDHINGGLITTEYYICRN